MPAPVTATEALARDQRLADRMRGRVTAQFEKELRRIRRDPLNYKRALRVREWENVISDIWLEAFEVYGPALAQYVGEPEERQKGELVALVEEVIGGDAGEVFNRYVRDSANGVVKTTRRRIGTALKQLDRPSDVRRVSRAIRRLYDTDFITKRPTARARRDARIALHETLLATAKYEHEAALEAQARTGRAYMQYWRTQGDERVRKSHRGIQSVPLGEKFTTAAGTIMEYPRDPSGPAFETYGCRCWTERKRL